MTHLKIGDIVKNLDHLAAPETAESWDAVGLLVGDAQSITSGAVISIDLTQKAIEVARSKKFRLIVTHHPCIFPKSRGLSKVIAGSNSGMSGLVFEALKNGISIVACHTNFDQCALEVVNSVSQGLGVQPQGRLIERGSGSLLKLVTFVPTGHLELVRKKICEAGAGHIGNYDHCTFSTLGEGTFLGRDGAQPFLGKVGILEHAQESRLETVFPKGLRKQVLEALFKAHPYEEVAYDFYPVEQSPALKGLVQGLGYGFWGEFPSPKPFSEVAKDVRRLFNLDGFLLTHSALFRTQSSRIQKVAFVAGKGSSFVEVAASIGCDLFITGEAGYHTAMDGSRKEMTVMELGHRESEKFFLHTMKGWLTKMGLRTVELDLPTQIIHFSRQEVSQSESATSFEPTDESFRATSRARSQDRSAQKKQKLIASHSEKSRNTTSEIKSNRRGKKRSP